MCEDGKDLCSTTGSDGSVMVTYIEGLGVNATIMAPGFMPARVNTYPERTGVPELTVPLVL